MRTSRTPQQWRELIEAQPASGLTVIDYCKEHGFSTNSFYNHRAKLSSPLSGSGQLIKAKVTRQVDVICHQALPITLTCGQVTLSLPAGVTPDYVIELVRGLG